MSIKLIVTDLDGTMFSSDHLTIPERNTEAFRKAHEMGIKVAVASGRTKVLTDKVVEAMPFLDYLITSNGAATYDLNKNEQVSLKLIDNAQTLEIFKILDAYSLCYEIYYKGECFISEKGFEKYDNHNIPEHFLTILRNHIKVVKSLPELIGKNSIEKINVLCLTPEQRIEITEKLKKTGEIYVTSSISQNMEMNNINADKGFAIRSLAGDLGIKKENIMCFGDGENDIEMLKFADFSFAMANASDDVKRKAKFETCTNDECGVALAIEKYVLEKQL